MVEPFAAPGVRRLAAAIVMDAIKTLARTQWRVLTPERGEPLASRASRDVAYTLYWLQNPGRSSDRHITLRWCCEAMQLRVSDTQRHICEAVLTRSVSRSQRIEDDLVICECVACGKSFARPRSTARGAMNTCSDRCREEAKCIRSRKRPSHAKRHASLARRTAA